MIIIYIIKKSKGVKKTVISSASTIFGLVSVVVELTSRSLKLLTNITSTKCVNVLKQFEIDNVIAWIIDDIEVTCYSIETICDDKQRLVIAYKLPAMV
jgi:hypothetical protein